MSTKQLRNFLKLILLSIMATSGKAEDIKPDLESANRFADLSLEAYKTMGSQFTDPVTKKVLYQFLTPEGDEKVDVIGYQFRPNLVQRHILRTEDEIVFDVTTHFDEFSRRVNPHPKDGHRKKFISVFGCSFAYGYGVEDNETLHYYLTKKSKDYFGYNYAIGGSAAHQMLAQLETKDIGATFVEEEGVWIYVYIHGHVPRVIGSMHERQWNLETPFYEWDGSQLNWKGSFKDAQPITTWFYSFLRDKLKFIDIFNRSLPAIKDQHYEYMCRLIKQSSERMKEIRPKSRFMMYIYSLEIDPYFESCLKRSGIDYIHPKYPNPIQKYFIKYDGHPMPIMHELAADQILEHLKD